MTIIGGPDRNSITYQSLSDIDITQQDDQSVISEVTVSQVNDQRLDSADAHKTDAKMRSADNDLVFMKSVDVQTTVNTVPRIVSFGSDSTASDNISTQNSSTPISDSSLSDDMKMDDSSKQPAQPSLSSQVTTFLDNLNISHSSQSYTGDSGIALTVPTPDPAFASAIDSLYMEKTESVNALLQGIEQLGVGERQPWEWPPHSAEKPEELLQYASDAKEGFIETIRGSIGGTAKADFGPGDKYALKSESSLLRKTNQIASKLMEWGKASSHEEAVKQFTSTCNDALRGTVTVKSPSELRPTIESLVEAFSNQGMDVAVSNKWSGGGYPDGYVGVHMVVEMKTPENKSVLTELQVHLEDFTTPEFKNIAHTCYEDSRSNGSDESLVQNANLATKALYLTQLTNALT